MVRTADSIDLWLDVQTAMRQLTRKQAEVVNLALLGYTQDEMAEKLGISQQNVNKRILRARQGVKTALCVVIGSRQV